MDNNDARAAQTTQHLISALFGPPQKRDFAVNLWNEQVLPARDSEVPYFTLLLTHPGALRRMFLPPGELTMAEAYLRGDFDIDGDIVAAASRLAELIHNLTLTDLLRVARHVFALPNTNPAQAYRTGRQPARLRGARHSPARDRAAAGYLYDSGNDFFALFLDKRMIYSGAYFLNRTSDLDSAQTAKLEYICRKLHLQPGERLLDIGCGWGGLGIFVAEKYGVQFTGITLSQQQANYGQAWIQRVGLSDKASIEIRDYRELDPAQQFDKIVSLGMVEHVGRARMSEYFESAYRVLRPGGLFLIQGVAAQRKRPNWLARLLFQHYQFAQHYFAPDFELVPIGESLTIAEKAGFEVRDVEALREHYVLTLRHWIRNLEARQRQAVRLKDERTYRTWRLLMAGAAAEFERGQNGLFQTLLSKSQAGAAELPLARVHL